MPRKKTENLDLLLALLMRIASPLKSITVQTTDEMVFIRPEDIAFITTDEKRIVIHDLEGNKWARFDSLAAMERKLEKDPRFFRSHRSFLINHFAVKSLYKGDAKGKVWKVKFHGAIQEEAMVSTLNLQEFKKLMELD